MKEKENQSIEWKEVWQDEYLKWICGYANAYGGTLYIGTDDDGNVVGIDNANSTTIDAKASAMAALGVESEAIDNALISKTVIRNIDKLFVKLQRSYEVIAPVAQIITLNPLLAVLGMKEGLEGGESFNLLEPVLNPETEEIEWKSVGVVKVDKKGIWDNRYTLTDEAPAEDSAEIKGTVLSANKKAALGMVVKQVVKGKKK